MTQESGPLVGTNFTDTQWRAIFGGEPGIVGDVDGTAFNITLGAGTDDALLGSTTQDSVAVVGGFMHRIAEGSTQAVTIPPSTNVVGRTDIIAVRLDAGTFTTAPGPCRLVRIAGVEGSAARPSLDEAPPGVEDFPLWAVTRKGNGTTAEGLNQAAKVDLRRRTGPNLVVPSGESLPPNVPLGTRVRRDGVEHVRVLNSSGTAEWSQSATAANLTSLTFDVNGHAVLNHGLPWTPRAVQATPIVAAGYATPITLMGRVDGLPNATQVVLKARTPSGPFTGFLQVLWTAVL